MERSDCGRVDAHFWVDKGGGYGVIAGYAEQTPSEEARLEQVAIGWRYHMVEINYTDCMQAAVPFDHARLTSLG